MFAVPKSECIKLFEIEVELITGRSLILKTRYTILKSIVIIILIIFEVFLSINIQVTMRRGNKAIIIIKNFNL